ncbi:hypothetical protein BDV33DRAFT_182735 [Aspergillus novoparasiticus]|uniref:Uncharacterized protein n=1 Tax=Aspergillus novoparasiticus TaxID=986946 RepID=A0A5N6EDJ9_9EURO|nr:hypothetical protein BDV33DRAFT_182735 [Aspergillus novoparasiticus]
MGLPVQAAFYSGVCRFIGKFAEADMKQPVRMWGIESDQTRSYRSGRPACHSETTYFLTLSPCSPVIGSDAKHYTAGSVYLSCYMICGCLPFTCQPNSTLLSWRHQHRIALYLAAYVSEDLFVSFTTGQWSYLCSSQVCLTTAQDCCNLQYTTPLQSNDKMLYFVIPFSTDALQSFEPLWASEEQNMESFTGIYVK